MTVLSAAIWVPIPRPFLVPVPVSFVTSIAIAISAVISVRQIMIAIAMRFVLWLRPCLGVAKVARTWVGTSAFVEKSMTNFCDASGSKAVTISAKALWLAALHRKVVKLAVFGAQILVLSMSVESGCTFMAAVAILLTQFVGIGRRSGRGRG